MGTVTLLRPDPPTGALLDRAIGWRCGTAVSVDRVPRTPADPRVVQYSALYGPADDRTPAGGAASTAAQARAAALGELLERYAAASSPLLIRAAGDIPDERTLDHDAFSLHSREQRARADFPHRDSYASEQMTRVFRLRDNEPAWVPANLVSNDPSLGHLATSNGLAAAPTSLLALLRATEELIERDALVTTWLHAVPARQVPMPPEALAVLGGADAFSLTALDLTPAFSPHPVAAVLGTAPLAGRDRHSIGLACRSTFAEAATKAALEWAQGISFAGAKTPAAGRPPDPEEVTSFDEHAVFYTRRPDLWRALPVWDGPEVAATAGTGTVGVAEQLAELVAALDAAGVELFYRDLTLPDLAACGVRAARVLSPQLVPIHPDHRWPHLGGTCANLALRYPWAPAGAFPAPWPHPLG